MSIKKYETLLKTVDSGSLTKASEELGYTQSAISQVISGLEDELGVKLLIRDRSGVRLTETGARILPSIRAVCVANAEVHRRVAELHGLELGTLRIGILSGLSVCFLSTVLSDFSKQHPDIRYELLEGTSSDIERWLREERVDCSFLCAPISEKFEKLRVAEETLLAVFPQTRKEERSPFPLERLAEESFIQQSYTVLPRLQDILKKKECQAKITYSGKDDYAVFSMIVAGLGMSILPESFTKQMQGSVVTRPCDPPLKRDVYLCYKDKRTLSRTARQLIGLLEELDPIL